MCPRRALATAHTPKSSPQQLLALLFVASASAFTPPALHRDLWSRVSDPQKDAAPWTVYETGDACVVSFAETSRETGEWSENLDFLATETVSIACPSTFRSPDAAPFEVDVWRGVGRPWNTWSRSPDAQLLQVQLMSACVGKARVVFAGWSRGGTKATLIALTTMYWTRNCGLTAFRAIEVELVTFGTPRFIRSSDVQHIELHNAFDKITNYRYCFDKDFACNVPPNVLGSSWRHWGSNVDRAVDGVVTVRHDRSGEMSVVEILRAVTSCLSPEFHECPWAWHHLAYQALVDPLVAHCPTTQGNCSEPERARSDCWQDEAKYLVSCRQWRGIQNYLP